MAYDLLVKNAMIPQGDELVPASILVADGKIAGFIAGSGTAEAEREIDAEGCMTLPGCIDSHVHFMDPGFCHRETFRSGSASAAAGGVTTVIDMPCCSVPSVRDIPSLENKLAAIGPQAMVDYALWGGVTGEDVQLGRLEHVQEQADAGVVAFKAYMTPSVPTYPRANDAELLEIFKTVALTGLPLGIHAENFAVCDYYAGQYAKDGRLDSVAWAEARMTLAEKVAIQMCISFSEHTGARMHVVHMSSGAGSTLIEAAKRRGLRVTAETCPHYLVLNAASAMRQWGSFAKIAPPLRSIEDNCELWDGLRRGAVDFVATDHAPYEIETEKDRAGDGYLEQFPGIPGVETMVAIMVSEGYNKRRLTLSRLVEVLSTNPARHYGLYPKKGALNLGSDADFTIIDTASTWEIRAQEMHTRAKYSPFDGLKLTGRVRHTIVRGEPVYSDGQFLVAPGFGQFVKRQRISELESKVLAA